MSLPWRRAPRAALASPVTVAVGVVIGMVVAFVATGTVFHVSASGSAAVQQVLTQRCTEENGASITRSSRGFFGGALVPDDTVARRLGALRASAERHGMDLVRRSRYAVRVPLTAEGQEVYARLISRDGALDQVRPLAGGGTDGVWMSAHLAQLHGIQPGSELVAVLESGTHRFKVAAIYPTIVDPVDEYWCSQRSEVLPLLMVGELPTPPPPIIVPDELMDEVTAAGLPLQVDQLQFSTSRPPRDAGAAARLAADVAAFHTEADQILAGAGGEQTRTARRFTDSAAFPAATGHRAQVAIGTSLLPLAGISLLVGLGAVIGLARQWTQRRGPEVRLLWTRGAAPSALGGKAVLELAGPLVLGTVLGSLGARAAVPALAPAGELDGWAVPAAVVAAVLALVASLAVLLVATTVMVRGEFQARRSARRARGRVRVLRWVPWEVAAVALAVVSWRRLTGGALVVNPSEPLPRVDVLALLFPLLCLAVLLGVTVRLAGLGLRVGHRLRGWRAPALLWALRRSAAQARLTVALVAVTGLAVGVVAVGFGLANTERQAVLDKGRVFLGSDAVVQLFDSLSDRVAVPAALRGSATKVAVRHGDVRGNRTGRVLVVDPATLADGMPWRSTWAGHELVDLLRLLGPPDAEGKVPVIQVGAAPPEDFLFDGLAPMRAVATVPTFPGREHANGMLVMSWDAFMAGDRRGFTRYLWTRGDPATAVAELERSGERTSLTFTAVGATDALPFLVVAWTFDFFVTLGLVLASIAVATLLVAIEARRRATALATGLLRRMGLRTGAQLASHTAELAALTGVAVAAGIAGAWSVLALATRHFDPYPRLSPSPIAVSLVPLSLAVVVVAAGAALAVAVLGMRSAARASVRELLRG